MNKTCICGGCFAEIKFQDSQAGDPITCPNCGVQTRAPGERIAIPAMIQKPPPIPVHKEAPKSAQIYADLVECPKCISAISSRATRCPHCGARISKSKIGVFGWVFLVVIFLIAIGQIASVSNRATPKKVVAAAVSAGRYQLVVKNTGADDWPALDLYLNGMPYFTYSCRIAPLAAGKSIRLSLSEFTKDSGARFDPDQYAVTQVYIGGSGFDFRGFRF